MTIEDTSPFDGAGDEFDAHDAFYRHLEANAKDHEGEGDQREDAEQPKEPVEAEGDPKTPETETDDDIEVELPFGTETKKFSLKEVREALEARNAPVATPAPVKDSEAVQRASVALERMVSQARERYAPFENVDWLALSRDPDISAQDFAALRDDARRALADVEFLTTELDGVVAQGRQQAQQSAMAERKACIDALMDPKTGIKGFGAPLYDQMMKFAETQGIPEMRQVASAPALKLLHLAMTAHQGQERADAQVRKVVKQARVIKPGSAGHSGGSDRSAAIKALKSSGGSTDAATNAFFADLNK